MFFLTFVSADKKRLLPTSWSHHVSGCSRIDAKLSALRELAISRKNGHLCGENRPLAGIISTLRGALALSRKNGHLCGENWALAKTIGTLRGESALSC